MEQKTKRRGRPKMENLQEKKVAMFVCVTQKCKDKASRLKAQGTDVNTIIEDYINSWK